ncbi:MAG: hypothetical protein IPG71_01350 [bacterium]|nr:hypothetical protein [bacterium]
MLTDIGTIFKTYKGKARIAVLCDRARSAETGIAELRTYYERAKWPERAQILEAIEEVTRTEPETAARQLEWIIGETSNLAPAIQREASRVIANCAQAFPTEVSASIPSLLLNSKHDGTIVRWAAALALAAIAKANPKTRAKLVPVFEKLAASEENNGVKSHYVKALKTIQKPTK